MAVRNVRIPLLEPVFREIRPEYIQHGHTFGDLAWNWTRNRFPFSRIYFFFKGEARIGHEGRYVKLRPGHAYLLPPNVTFHLNALGSFEKFFFHFRFEIIPGRDLFAHPEGYPPFCLPCPGARRWVAEASEGLPGLLSLRSRVEALLFEFYRKFPFPAKGLEMKDLLIARKYEPVFAASEKLAWRDIRLADVAASMGRSLSSLSRSFRGDTGMTISRYMLLRMVERAQNRLLLSEDPIRVVAHDLGFDDEKYFTRLFRQVMRSSPSSYRAQNRLPEKG